jgi:hypothetical protein
MTQGMRSKNAQAGVTKNTRYEVQAILGMLYLASTRYWRGQAQGPLSGIMKKAP